MIEASLTYFDIIVLAVMGLSCMFAFFRGFVRELLSLGAWIGAGIITLYYFRDVAEMIKPNVKSEMVAGGLAALTVYVVALMGFSIANMLIVRMIKDGGEVGPLDNFLGLTFGAFRGAFLISMGYFMMTFFITPESKPDWLRASYTDEIVEKGAILFGQAAPDYMVEHSSLKAQIEAASGKTAREKIKEEIEDTADDGNKDMKEFVSKLKKEKE